MAIYGPTDYLDEPTDTGGITLDQLESAPANPADLNARLGALQGPTLVPVPDPYVPKEYQAGGLDQILENFGRAFGNLQLNRPRGFGGGFAAGLAGGLASQGGRVAQARAKFDAAEQARQRLIDTERETATKENLRREGQFGAAKTGAVINNAVATEAFNRNAPVREAAAKRADEAAARAQANADRQQRSLDRQNDLAQANTTQQISTQFNADPDVVGYRTASNNLKLANVAARQQNGVGDNALIRLYVRSTDDPRVASVVRESEAAGVQASVGLLAKAKVLPATWVKGDLLTNEGREAIKKSMRETTAQIKPQYDQAYAQYRDRVNAFGKQSGIALDPKNILREYSTVSDSNDRLETDPQFQRYLTSGR